jgi:hypothetical protein
MAINGRAIQYAMEPGMKAWILAVAIALAGMGSVLGNCEIATAGSLETTKITDVNIGQIKGQMKLTAAQQPLWARVEVVLRSIAREQAQDKSVGFLRRVGRRVVSIAFDGTVTQRIESAALPLLASLDEEQKATARRLAKQMGIEDMVVLSN